MRHFFARLRALIEWAPVIWRDADYDYGHLLRIIRYKLERMEPVIRSGNSAYAEDSALEIRRAILLLSRIEDDPDDEMNNHYMSWHRTDEDLNAPCPESEEAHAQAVEASARRVGRNWHAVWKHFDRYMRGWWD